eukprot:224965-Prymnesium_polylepis.2
MELASELWCGRHVARCHRHVRGHIRNAVRDAVESWLFSGSSLIDHADTKVGIVEREGRSFLIARIRTYTRVVKHPEGRVAGSRVDVAGDVAQNGVEVDEHGCGHVTDSRPARRVRQRRQDTRQPVRACRCEVGAVGQHDGPCRDRTVGGSDRGYDKAANGKVDSNDGSRGSEWRAAAHAGRGEEGGANDVVERLERVRVVARDVRFFSHHDIRAKSAEQLSVLRDIRKVVALEGDQVLGVIIDDGHVIIGIKLQEAGVFLCQREPLTRRHLRAARWVVVSDRCRRRAEEYVICGRSHWVIAQVAFGHLAAHSRRVQVSRTSPSPRPARGG